MAGHVATKLRPTLEAHRRPFPAEDVDGFGTQVCDKRSHAPLGKVEFYRRVCIYSMSQFHRESLQVARHCEDGVCYTARSLPPAASQASRQHQAIWCRVFARETQHFHRSVRPTSSSTAFCKPLHNVTGDTPSLGIACSCAATHHSTHYLLRKLACSPPSQSAFDRVVAISNSSLAS